MSEAEKILFWRDMFETFKPAIFEFLIFISFFIVIFIVIKLVFKLNREGTAYFLLGAVVMSGFIAVNQLL